MTKTVDSLLTDSLQQATLPPDVESALPPELMSNQTGQLPSTQLLNWYNHSLNNLYSCLDPLSPNESVYQAAETALSEVYHLARSYIGAKESDCEGRTI